MDILLFVANIFHFTRHFSSYPENIIGTVEQETAEKSLKARYRYKSDYGDWQGRSIYKDSHLHDIIGEPDYRAATTMTCIGSVRNAILYYTCLCNVESLNTYAQGLDPGDI